MVPRKIAAEIEAELSDAGLTGVSAWRVHRRAWSRRLRSASGELVIRIVRCLDFDVPWARLTAYELIASHPTAVRALTPVDVRALSRGLAHWGDVDAFACYVAGPAWRERRLPSRQIWAWLSSSDRWLRRTAVVCTVALNVRARGGSGDVERTLAVCSRAVADRDDMVVKAVSWGLRSLIGSDRHAVGAFIQAHEHELDARITREVRTKLATGRKA
ncbi:MAG: DNA alkylation repair protein [Gemmatimonadales bacterium]|nr:DNA alkylation repair protein [Gemmatimonadales bacterium]